jgi:ADP-ribose pyrophosphatase
MKLDNYFALMDSHPELFRNENAPLKIVRNETEILNWQNEQKDTPPEYIEIGILSQDSYIMTLRDLVEFPDGSKFGHTRVIYSANLSGKYGVIILPVLESRVLLINHFRHSTRQWHLEVPRGYGEIGLSSEENVYKELAEEVGAETSSLVSLGSVYPETGLESQKVDMFLANLISVKSPNANEGIESFVWLTVKELEEWIANEKITDGFTIAAYTKAKLKGLI